MPNTATTPASTSTLEALEQQLLPLLSNVSTNGDQKWRANCPIHEDDGQKHDPSLYIEILPSGVVVMFCHVCNDKKIGPRICGKFGLPIRIFFPDWGRSAMSTSNGKKKKRNLGTKTAEFEYVDIDGVVAYKSIRFEQPPTPDKPEGSKQFVLARPNGRGGWILNVRGIPRIPYRLPELIASAKEDKIVYVPEGERKVDALMKWGLVATCNPLGAGKWLKEFSPYFRGRRVIILPDNDPVDQKTGRSAGKDHAAKIVEYLQPVAEIVRILELPGLPEKGDIIDWQASGHTVEEFLTLVDEAFASESSAESTPAPADSTERKSVLSNLDQDANGKFTVPKAMTQILADVDRLTGGWPRRVGQSLFTPSPTDGVSWISNSESLFGFIGQVTGSPPVFDSKAGRHTKGEVFTCLQRTAKKYVAVETLPHEPAIPDHYYTMATPSPGSGEHLNWLLDRFSPETLVDRDLILAALATPLWGGPYGKRPVFVFTAPEGGRGSGKSTVAFVIADLFGGYLDVSQNEDAFVIRQRLLSPEGLSKRICVVDNLKSFKFSWAEFESMVTAPVISGKRMFVGEFSRPNVLTWYLTLNGASFSKDVSQRCVVIHLAKPIFGPDWEDSTREFIQKNREGIIADLVAFFRADPTPLHRYSRWGAWDKGVLSRLPEPTEAAKVIIERQKFTDAEQEESEIIESYFSAKLSEFNFDVSVDRIFVPSVRAAKWLSEAIGEKMGTTHASRKLGQLIDEGSVQNIIRATNNHLGRGFHWVGPECDPEGQIFADLEDRISNKNWRA